MKNTILSVLIVFTTMLSIGIYGKNTFGAQNENTVKDQTLCPVLGFPIDKNIYTDYKGRRIYFCCEDCIGKFKNNPEYYMKKLKDNSGLNSQKGHAHIHS